MQDYMIQNVLEALIVAAAFVGVAYSPLFRALGNRLMHGKTPPPGQAFEDPRLDDVLEDNAMLRRQVEEMQERVAFAERMLAQAKDRGVLGAPRAGA